MQFSYVQLLVLLCKTCSTQELLLASAVPRCICEFAAARKRRKGRQEDMERECRLEMIDKPRLCSKNKGETVQCV